MVFDRYFSFNLWYKNGRLTFWHYPKDSTISQSYAISSQRLKCANLTQAGTNTFDTVGNRPVNTSRLWDGIGSRIYLNMSFSGDIWDSSGLDLFKKYRKPGSRTFCKILNPPDRYSKYLPLPALTVFRRIFFVLLLSTRISCRNRLKIFIFLRMSFKKLFVIFMSSKTWFEY